MLLTKITSAMVTRAEFIYKHGDKLKEMTKIQHQKFLLKNQ